MLYLIAAVLWPLAFAGLYFLYPVVLPGETPPDSGFLMLTALLGMAAFIFAGALRILGFLRDDKVKREKSRAEAGNHPPVP
jgi:hypothetical protein